MALQVADLEGNVPPPKPPPPTDADAPDQEWTPQCEISEPSEERGTQPRVSSLNSLSSQRALPIMGEVAYRGLAGEIVDIIGPHSEADPVGILLTTLTLFGGYVGAGPHMIADGALHSARLYTVLVGKTSRGRKGTAYANVSRILEAADSYFAVDRVFSGLASGEGLIAALSPTEDNPFPDPRLITFEPEYARLLQAAGRKGSTLSAIVRDAWDRGRLQVTTRHNPLRVDGAHVVLTGHITADELRRELSTTEVANGYANRALYALVERSKRLPEGGSLTDGAIQDLGKHWQETATACRKIERMHRTAAARDRWRDIYMSIDDDVNGMVGAVTARAEAQMLRLSIAYALLDASPVVDLVHVEAALAVWTYCEESAHQIWTSSSGDLVRDKLIAALTEAGKAGLDGTAQSALFDRHASSERLDGVRKALESSGEAVTVKQPTLGRPRIVTYAAEHAPKKKKGSL